MIIAVASGKGGTGKTTVAVNLAAVAKTDVSLLDCDVEAPNAHLFLGGGAFGSEEQDACAGPDRTDLAVVGVAVPRIDEDLCDGCGECSRFCAYHAIVSFGTVPLVFPELCHGCGGCTLVCPRRAISEIDHRIGVIRQTTCGRITLIEGRLDVGRAMAPPLIRAVKARLIPGRDAILDAPPGTSCPMVATVRGADYVLLVTEPTPFGLHDLELAVATVRQLELPCGVVVNRAGCGDDRIQAFCRAQGLPVLAEIPDDRTIAETYARGALLVDALPHYRPLFSELADRVRRAAVRPGARTR